MLVKRARERQRVLPEPEGCLWPLILRFDLRYRSSQRVHVTAVSSLPPGSPEQKLGLPLALDVITHVEHVFATRDLVNSDVLVAACRIVLA